MDQKKLKIAIRKEKARLVAKILFVFLIAILLIYLLIHLDKIYHFSEKFNKKISIWIMGNESLFPAMNDTLLIGSLIVILLTIASAISYLFYYQYNDKKKKLEGKLLQKTEIKIIKRFLPFFLFCIFHSLFDFVYEELCISFESSLKGTLKKEYILTMYAMILLMMIADQAVELIQIYLLNNKLSLVPKEDNSKTSSVNKERSLKENNKDKEKFSVRFKEKLKEYLIKLFILSIVSLLLLLVSIGINSIQMSFELNFTMGGDQITLFSNKDNIFFLSLAAIILIPIMSEFIFPAIEKGYERKDGGLIKTTKEKFQTGWKHFKNETFSDFQFLKSLGLSLLIAITVNISIFSINTLQSMNLSNPACLIPISLLLLASIAFVGLQIKQFCDEDKEQNPNQSIEGFKLTNNFKTSHV